jgi:1,4-alpha-glucan branching enzyme
MGEEEGGRAPFLYFTDHRGELADAVREGRRREFAGFTRFTEEIPDPNALDTFERSRPAPGDAARRTLYRKLLDLRAAFVTPHLAGARSLSAEAGGPACVAARWRLGNGSVLTLACNLGRDSGTLPPAKGDLLFETRPGASEQARAGRLDGPATVAFLEQAT